MNYVTEEAQSLGYQSLGSMIEPQSLGQEKKAISEKMKSSYE